MLELAHDPTGTLALNYAGDALNTAAHVSRHGLNPHFISAIGEDHYSDMMLNSWRARGVEVSHVLRHPERLPGLYAIHKTQTGDREFLYWRSHSAAREMCTLSGWTECALFAERATVLYFTGITLAILSDSHRNRLLDLARHVSHHQGHFLFDPNYRPKLWEHPEQARSWMSRAASMADIVLATDTDDQALWGEQLAPTQGEPWLHLGARNVVMKKGDQGSSWICQSAPTLDCPAKPPDSIVDTTGAGDAFNAGLIVGLANGSNRYDAMALANAIAADSLRFRGALPPIDASPYR